MKNKLVKAIEYVIFGKSEAIKIPEGSYLLWTCGYCGIFQSEDIDELREHNKSCQLMYK